jgi:imidazole glycerol-phosphate synthase subunit HisH
VRVPQFGWNRIEPEPGCRYLEGGFAYFANSYRALAAPGCRTASAEHGERFIAGLERGDLVACQFHPELSGAFGRDLLARWLEGQG